MSVDRGSVDHPLNMSDAEYTALLEERAARIGDAGLHIIPAEYLVGSDEVR